MRKINMRRVCFSAQNAYFPNHNDIIEYWNNISPWSRTLKMRNLEELEPPKDLKIQTAFKIVKMKTDVKDLANTAAASA